MRTEPLRPGRLLGALAAVMLAGCAAGLREGALLAEGPAGVIGVARYEGEVWLLER